MKNLALILALILAPAAHAQDVAGRFDYYVLSLSWSPSWCRAEGKDGDPGQCAPGRRKAFVVHGLWPQYEEGWPEDCRTPARDPTRRDTREMADIMGSSGLAWYQWKKHGRCTGLSSADYFALTRKAAALIAIPATLRNLPRDVSLPAKVVEDAFYDMGVILKRLREPDYIAAQAQLANGDKRERTNRITRHALFGVADEQQSLVAEAIGEHLVGRVFFFQQLGDSFG
mgnify:CR=1 FL=1